VCINMACIAYSCTQSFLLPNTKRTKGRTQADANRARFRKMYSVMAWFDNEKELSDIMPDTGVHHFAYPRRHAVWER
jgi:hypothetical protein